MMAKRLLAHPKVTVLWNTEPIEAKGDGDLLTSIATRDTKTGEIKELAVKLIFVILFFAVLGVWSGADSPPSPSQWTVLCYRT